MIIHSYKHMYTHSISINTFKKLNQFNVEIHVGHKKQLFSWFELRIANRNSLQMLMTRLHD
jgi:hypothetical protein